MSIQEIKGNKVYVIGQVNKPGEFIMNPTVDVMQALSMAGGTTPFAALGDITILRRTPTGKQSLPFRYNDVVRGKRLDQNIDSAKRRRRSRAVRCVMKNPNIQIQTGSLLR